MCSVSCILQINRHLYIVFCMLQDDRSFNILILEAQSMKKSKVKHQIHIYNMQRNKSKIYDARAMRSLALRFRPRQEAWTLGCRKPKKFFGKFGWKDPLSVFRYRLNQSGNLCRKNALLNPFFSLKHRVLHHLMG